MNRNIKIGDSAKLLKDIWDHGNKIPVGTEFTIEGKPSMVRQIGSKFTYFLTGSYGQFRIRAFVEEVELIKK